MPKEGNVSFQVFFFFFLSRFLPIFHYRWSHIFEDILDREKVSIPSLFFLFVCLWCFYEKIPFQVWLHYYEELYNSRARQAFCAIFLAQNEGNRARRKVFRARRTVFRARRTVFRASTAIFPKYSSSTVDFSKHFLDFFSYEEYLMSFRDRLSYECQRCVKSRWIFLLVCLLGEYFAEK